MCSTEPPETDLRTLRERITVLAVAADRSIPDPLESALRSEADFELRTAATTASMLEQLSSVDCLVVVASDSSGDAESSEPSDSSGDAESSEPSGATESSESPSSAEAVGDSASSTPDGKSETTESEPEPKRKPNANPPANAADALARIRSHVPALPIVAVTVADDCDDHRDPSLPVDSTARSERRTAHVPVAAAEPAADLERVSRRVRQLVERRRLGALSRRSLAGLELAQDPIAITAPDGTLEFANRRFAVQFGADPAALSGRSWRTCFADDSVAHLESTAIPTVEDGWRWTGRCTGRRLSGETFPARVRLGGLDDGSLLFLVTELEAADDGPDAEPTDAADRSDDSRTLD